MSNFRRQEAWRQHPLLTNGMKDAFPGFKRAVKIFAAYLVAEQIYKLASTPIEDHHEYGHGVEFKRTAKGRAPELERSHGHH